MQIINYLDLFLGAVINIMTYLIIIKYVFKFKPRKNNFIYLIILLTGIYIMIMNLFTNEYKIIKTIFILSLSIRYIFNESYIKSFVAVTFSMLYLFISEITLMLISSLLNISNVIFNINNLGSSFGNILVLIFLLPYLRINKIKNYMNKILENISYNKKTFLIFLALIFLMFLMILKNTLNLSNTYSLTLNILLLIIFIILIVLLLNEILRTQNISNNYNMLLSYLDEYEKEIIEKRKIIHEFNNKIIIINGLVDNKKELKKYLNEIIIEQKQIKNNKLIQYIDLLPTGLKGIICYKLSNVQNKLNISITSDKNIKIDDIIFTDTLKSVGILLDNAIEASLESNEKKLDINIQKEENILIITILNTFNNNVKLSDIYDNGYSTKGINRGYGLSILKDISRKNNKIKIDINIENNIFISTLRITI